jgi:hypothetical protein
MLTITTPLLVTGNGAAALVAAKVAAGRGVPCLVVGHEPVEDDTPVVLSDDTLAALQPNGVLDVLRPYAAAQEPFTIAPIHFEHGLKHHCVADMLVTVYDRMWFEPATDVSPASHTGVLTDGNATWRVEAANHFEADYADLDTAIRRGADVAFGVVATQTPNR